MVWKTRCPARSISTSSIVENRSIQPWQGRTKGIVTVRAGSPVTTTTAVAAAVGGITRSRADVTATNGVADAVLVLRATRTTTRIAPRVARRVAGAATTRSRAVRSRAVASAMTRAAS